MAKSRQSRRGETSFLVCLVGPLAIGVLLNALVRPALAASLNGVQHASGAGVRGHDTWWTFEESVRAAHPLLTSFLSASHGVIGVWALLLTAILLVARSVVIRIRRSNGSNHDLTQ